MKKKLILICLMSSMVLVGCFKNDEENLTEDTTSSTISSTQQDTEDTKKDKTNVSIFTKDDEIKYLKISNNDEAFDNKDEHNKMLSDYITKQAENQLIQLENDENIRIELPNQLPKDNQVNITKTYVTKDDKGNYKNSVENMVVEINKNGDIDFKHTFDTNDKYLQLVVYEALVNWEDISVKYNFAISTANQNILDNKSSSVLGYLSQEEQKIYDSYKKDKNIDIFKDATPTTMVKYYTQAIMEEEYNIAYTLYKGEDENTYIKTISSLNKEQKEDYISNLKSAVNGKFVEESSEKGYIEYELQQNHLRAIDMAKENGVWKIQYMPAQ